MYFLKGVVNMFLFLDFETSCDLDINVGTYNYVNHQSFKVISSAWYKTDNLNNLDAVVSGQVQFCLGFLPIEELNDVTDIVCHNAFFEGSILHKLAISKYSPTDFKFVDTMSMCAVVGMPLSLGRASVAVGLPGKYEKEHEVKRCLASKPISEFTSYELHDLAEYNKIDVLMTIKLMDKLKGFYSAYEHSVSTYTLNKNFLGIKIDTYLLDKCLEVVDEFKKQCTEEIIRKLSDGVLYSVNQNVAMATYLGIENIQQDTLLKKLKQEDLSENHKELIKIRLFSTNPLFSKFSILKRIMHPRIPGSDSIYNTNFLNYHSAITGRFSGRDFQIQNLPASKYSRDEILSKISERPVSKETLPYLFSAFRKLILPHHPTHKVLCCDYAQIEPRILAYVSGQNDMLQQFRNNEKVYEIMASKLFNVPVDSVTKEQRHFGKTAVLGFGYGLGAQRFAEQNDLDIRVTEKGRFRYLGQYIFFLDDREYNLYDDKEEIKKFFVKEKDEYVNWQTDAPVFHVTKFSLQIINIISRYNPTVISPIHLVQQYRRANSQITGLWGKIDTIVKTLVDHGKETLNCLEFETKPSFLPNVDTMLTIKLPSKRKIVYPGYKYDALAKKPKVFLRSQSGDMRWFDMWGGSFTENICQAIARDILVAGLLALKENKFATMFSVHDEFVVSTDPNRLVELEKVVLASTPAWATDIPLKVETTIGDTYE